jgi:integrase
MALFKVNTGTREKEVCRLRWEWEYKVPDVDSTVFIIPGKLVKNGDDRLVVLNSVASSVVDAVRGNHPEVVFTYKGRPLSRMRNSAWRRARVKVGLPMVRVHDLKHTFGHRLRAAGVSFEDRQDLLGHRSHRITTHYSAPDIRRLLEAAEKVVDTKMEPVLRAVSHPKSPQSAALLPHSVR